jgi:hypothetical protein
MTPYLLIKVSWVVGAALGIVSPSSGMSLTAWLTLNIATVGMAAAGITLALALADVKGVHLPDVVVLAFAWIGSGFLVPMLPYIAVSSVLAAGGIGHHATTASGPAPGWESFLIQLSFAGLGLGLAVALPLYLLERRSAPRTRWLAERVASPAGAGRLAVVATSAAVVAGTLQCYWAAGGRLGLAHPGARDLDWYLITANSGLWALVGAVAVWLLAHRRTPTRRPWVLTAVMWTTSGFLVTWNCWRLPFVVYLAAVGFPEDHIWPEHLGVEAGVCLVSVVAGAAILLALLRSGGQGQERAS